MEEALFDHSLLSFCLTEVCILLSDISGWGSESPRGHLQAVEFRPNLLDDGVTGRVAVYFCGLQKDTVDAKSTQRDIIIERIWSKFHSLTHL